MSREERDDMLLSGVLTQTGPQEYTCTLKPVVMHSFAEMGKLRGSLEERNPLRRFLPGEFVVDMGEQRRREMLETPEALVFRLRKDGKLKAA